ncbi:uncharacterized protein V1516DRAFT_668304 [Lipomyces oligophaga]|uniref:uncharacterized protein n=1 Tax=Lipomyces oligophaga TaxID=45792 RepID=UPI0034CFCBCF
MPAKRDIGQIKSIATSLFTSGNYEEARVLYQEASKIAKDDPVFESNIAACSIKLKDWQTAVDACNEGLKIAHGSSTLEDARRAKHKLAVKMLWRRGVARRNLGDLKQARQDLETALTIEPENKAVKEELNGLAWDEKKSWRKQKTEPKPIEEAKAKIVVEPEIEIRRLEVVDTLPDEFAKLIVESNPAGKSKSVEKIEQRATESELIPLQKLAIPESFPRGGLSIYDLTQLLRRPASERRQVLAYLYRGIPTGTLNSTFGRGGIEGDAIEAFLEAVTEAGRGATSEPDKREYVDRAKRLLTEVAGCGRFGIARVFVDDNRIKQAFGILRQRAGDVGLEDELDDLERKWK